MSQYNGPSGYPSPSPHQNPGFQPSPHQSQPPYQGYNPSPSVQQGAYGQTPPQGYPPQGQFPPQGYSSSPNVQQGSYGHPPPQGFAPQGYAQPNPGFPPQQQFSQAWPPTPASPGYDPSVQISGDASRDADALRKAMKGFGSDKKALIRILSQPDPLQMALLSRTYETIHKKRQLSDDIGSETSGNLEDVLKALVAGPLLQDVVNIKTAVDGIGTNEDLLNDVLLGRTNADIRAIAKKYSEVYRGRTLAQDVGDDLSSKTKQLFKMILTAQRAEESAPIDPQRVEHDVRELHSATERFPNDTIAICAIFAYSSDSHLRAISHNFSQRYQTNLEEKIKGATGGHMEDALVLMLGRATDRAMSDAVQLEEAMAGLGTKDKLLINRVVRIHWNRAHMDQVKRAYQVRYKRDLIDRVKGETSGHYEEALVACLT